MRLSRGGRADGSIRMLASPFKRAFKNEAGMAILAENFVAAIFNDRAKTELYPSAQGGPIFQIHSKPDSTVFCKALNFSNDAFDNFCPNTLELMVRMNHDHGNPNDVWFWKRVAEVKVADEFAGLVSNGLQPEGVLTSDAFSNQLFARFDVRRCEGLIPRLHIRAGIEDVTNRFRFCHLDVAKLQVFRSPGSWKHLDVSVWLKMTILVSHGRRRGEGKVH